MHEVAHNLRHLNVDWKHKDKSTKVFAFIEFAIQRKLIIIPRLDNTIIHIRKQFCGANKACSICLMVLADTWQRNKCA